MGLHKGIDAAYPPDTAPRWCEVVCGYIGGNTPHVWTLDEWHRFSHLRQVPIWTCYGDPAGPETQAAEAARAARALGWAAYFRPHTRVIVGDCETMQDESFWTAFDAALYREGFLGVCYGSLSTVLANRAVRVWAADWNDIPALYGGASIHGMQYIGNMPWENTAIDVSVFDELVYFGGGIGPRQSR
jgi:hypothetical protein